MDLQDTPIRVGPQKLHKDWTHAADTAAGIARILKADSLNHDIYNLSIGQYSELLEILETMKYYIPEINYEVSDTSNISRSLVPHGPLDISRVQVDFGFSSQYNIQSGLGAYLKSIKRLAE